MRPFGDPQPIGQRAHLCPVRGRVSPDEEQVGRGMYFDDVGKGVKQDVLPFDLQNVRQTPEDRGSIRNSELFADSASVIFRRKPIYVYSRVDPSHTVWSHSAFEKHVPGRV